MEASLDDVWMIESCLNQLLDIKVHARPYILWHVPELTT
jgi:hypothetical protein